MLKEQAYGYLNAELRIANAKLEASKRPKGVLTKYRELVRNSQRKQILNQ